MQAVLSFEKPKSRGSKLILESWHIHRFSPITNRIHTQRKRKMKKQIFRYFATFVRKRHL